MRWFWTASVISVALVAKLSVSSWVILEIHACPEKDHIADAWPVTAATLPLPWPIQYPPSAQRKRTIPLQHPTETHLGSSNTIRDQPWPLSLLPSGPPAPCPPCCSHTGCPSSRACTLVPSGILHLYVVPSKPSFPPPSFLTTASLKLCSTQTASFYSSRLIANTLERSFLTNPNKSSSNNSSNDRHKGLSWPSGWHRPALSAGWLCALSAKPGCCQEGTGAISNHTTATRAWDCQRHTTDMLISSNRWILLLPCITKRKLRQRAGVKVGLQPGVWFQEWELFSYTASSSLGLWSLSWLSVNCGSVSFLLTVCPCSQPWAQC